MGKQGFSRNCRMTERPQFIRLFDNPKSHKAPTFQAFWKLNDRKSPRLGITIKGRLSSVWRFRLKRAVREWFRFARGSLENSDINIVVRVPALLNMEYVDTLKKQLRAWKH